MLLDVRDASSRVFAGGLFTVFTVFTVCEAKVSEFTAREWRVLVEGIGRDHSVETIGRGYFAFLSVCTNAGRAPGGRQRRRE